MARTSRDGDRVEETVPAATSVTRTRRSTDQTLRALRAAGRLGPVDAALVAMLRKLIDDELAEPAPNVWAVVRLAGEWRALLSQLLERGARLPDDQLSAFFFNEEAR